MRLPVLSVLAISLCCGCGDDGGTGAGGGGTTGTGTGGATSSGGGSTVSTGGTGGGGGGSGTGGMAAIECGDAASFEQPNWCVEDIMWSPLEVTTGMLRVELNFVDTISGDPITNNVHVKACARTDTLCASPLGEADSDLSASSMVNFLIPVGPVGSAAWDGYVEVTPAATNGADIPTNLIILHRPQSNDFSGTTFGLVTNTTLAGMAALMGTDLEAGHGHLGIETDSCCDLDAPGVHVELDTTDASTVLRYLKNGNDPTDATLTATDASGALAVANVPTGNTGVAVVNVTATFEADALFLGDVDLIVRDGAVTTVGMYPEPR